jgi:antitoxin MazE
MRSEIKRWGNSAAVRLPKNLLNQTGLDVDSAVSMNVEENRIVIEALDQAAPRHLQLPFSEAALVAGLDAHTAHADELPGSLLEEETADW